MNQPSDEALKKLLKFLLETSVPRIIAKENSKEVNKDEDRKLARS
jgi:hypothetical protein